MAYISQVVALNDTAAVSDDDPITWRAVLSPLPPQTSIAVQSGGTGYVAGDVGKTVTINPPSATNISALTPGSLTIGSVSGGHVASFATGGWYTGVYTGSDLSDGLTWPVAGSTTGSGATCAPWALPTPVLLSADAGLPSSFTALTISLWCDQNGSNFSMFSGGCAISGSSVTLLHNANGGAGSNQIFAGTFINSSVPNGVHNILISFDTTTKTILYYFDDVQQTMQSGVGWAATPTGTSVDNGSDCHWIVGNIGWLPSSTGLCSLYIATGFTDLTVTANRRVFINSDLTAADPSVLSSVATNIYLKKGDQPSAIASNYGGTGTWVFPDGGEGVRFNEGWDSSKHYLQVVDYSFAGTFNTPTSGSLTGSNGLGGQTQNLRPGGSVAYALDTSPGAGTAVVNADGSFTYTPNTDFYGTDTFTYTGADTMPVGYVQPFGYTLDINAVSQAPSVSWTQTATVTITIPQPNVLLLVALYPMNADTDEYGFESTAGADFPASFSQLTLSAWLCKNVTVAAANGVDAPYNVSMAFTPSHATLSFADASSNVLFSGSFTNPGSASDEYHVMFSIDTSAQTYTLWVASNGPAVQWTTSDAAFGSVGDIDNSGQTWTITSDLTTQISSGVGNVWLDNSYVNFDDTTTRNGFQNSDGTWLDPGTFGETYTGTSPLNWLTVQFGNTPSDILNNYGQNNGASTWSLLNVGTDPTTSQLYADMAFDDCAVSPSNTNRPRVAIYF